MATKINVYLDVNGKERIAKGDPLYSWHYAVREAESSGPEGSTLLGTIEYSPPSKEDCIPVALAAIAKSEADARSDLNVILLELAERRNKLLALPNEVPHDPA